MAARMGILKFVCLTVLLAFVAQVFMTRAEHSGLLECHVVCSESGEKSPSNPEKDSAFSLHCCCNTVAAPHVSDFEWSAYPHAQLSFQILDELVQDGPAKSIDLPPQLLS